MMVDFEETENFGRLPVFVYGTLKPEGRLFHHISHAVREMIPASIRGELYDTPFGYPLLLNAGIETFPLVCGVLLVAAEELYDNMIRTIDVIEEEAGFEKGAFDVTLEDGKRTRAVVYFFREPPRYAHPYGGTSWA